jgi:hypothetical protein
MAPSAGTHAFGQNLRTVVALKALQHYVRLGCAFEQFQKHGAVIRIQ